MAIPSVGNDVATYMTGPSAASNDRGSLRSAFRALTQSIQSGDLGAAQQAFATLQQLIGSASGSGAASTAGGQAGSGGLAGDLQSVGAALQSGDVHAARDALAKLQQDAHAAGGAHHRHGHRHPEQSVAATNPSAASAAPAANPSSSTPGGIDVTA